MGISLAKGGNISLSKEDPSLTEIIVGLGWDVRQSDGKDFDLDASAFLLNESGKVITDGLPAFCFYHNLSVANGAVEHQGDNLTGSSDNSDAEQIKINLSALPSNVHSVAIAVTIYQARERRQNFGQVKNGYVRIVNAKSGRETARFDLTEDVAGLTAMVFCEVYRHGSEFKFRAIGQGYEGGLYRICQQYGLSADNDG